MCDSFNLASTTTKNLEGERGGGVRQCGYIIFNNIIIKCLNVEKGRGGSENVDKDFGIV